MHSIVNHGGVVSVSLRNSDCLDHGRSWPMRLFASHAVSNTTTTTNTNTNTNTNTSICDGIYNDKCNREVFSASS
jgi:hypothetical protein